MMSYHNNSTSTGINNNECYFEYTGTMNPPEEAVKKYKHFSQEAPGCDDIRISEKVFKPMDVVTAFMGRIKVLRKDWSGKNFCKMER